MRRLIVSWSAALLACGGPPAGTVTLEETSVETSVSTDRQTYDSGDAVTMTLVVRNADDHPVTLRFASGQRFDFAVVGDEGQAVWRWSADRGFLQVLGEESLASGEALTYRATLEDGLAPGRYTVRGILTALGAEVTDDTTIEVR